MYVVRCLLAFLLLSLPVTALAEKDPAKELAKQIKGQTLILRVNYDSDVLTFDAQGNAKSKFDATLAPWIALHIDSAYADKDLIGITGHRVVLTLNEPPGAVLAASDIQSIAIAQPLVNIAIDRDPNHPDELKAALHHVFFDSVLEAFAGTSGQDAQANLTRIPSLTAPPQSSAPCPVPGHDSNEPFPGAAQGVAAPQIVHSVDLAYPFDKRYLEATVTLNMVIDNDGFPSCIRITKSAGPEFDRSAVLSASQFRYIPAKRGAQPTPVETHLDVLFRKDHTVHS